MRLKYLKYMFATATILIMFSCAKMNSGVGGVLNLDTNLKVAFAASSFINPDESASASPVFVRMYELKTPAKLEQANFIDLYENDVTALAGDFIAKHELKRFIPNTNRVETFVLNKETQYVAFFAEFYDYKSAKYKLVFPVTANNVIRNSVKIAIESNTITLVSAKKR